MKVRWAWSLCWCVLVAPALAGSYEDFNYGVSAKKIGEYDAAIRYLSAALSAGDLLPNLVPVAHLDRAEAYAAKNQMAAAAVDLDAAIKLDPKLVEAYEFRADLYASEDRLDLAVADCRTVFVLDPGVEDEQFRCARFDWMAGNYALAGSKFAEQLLAEDKGRHDRNPYVGLWLKLSTLRQGAPDDPEFTNSMESLDSDKWPGPILQLFLGKATVESLNALAPNGDPKTPANEKCEIGFYVGEWQLAHGDVLAARALLQQAVDTCPADFIERIPAVIELKKLK